jgi:lipopolysaccharide transport system ATP-binding protein
MNIPVVEVRGLSKQYRLGATISHDTLRDAIADGFKSIFGRNSETPQQSDDETIWALKDVSFDVKEGEVLGIIGRNGAGKSTLLKILSRITEPTEGAVMGSLLEVGTGFHPELTGRENIFLNGAILGMKKEEIKRKFDEMVAFAEIEKFLDTPVKRYSSGMYVRLAFAVAANFEPEILIVDEVLAVGDAQFQKKCLGKMGDVAGEGRTVLFVSHNMVAVQSLCSRAIWLDEGKIVEEGETDQVVSDYLKGSALALTEQVWEDVSTAPGNDDVRIRRVYARPLSGESLSMDHEIEMGVEFWALKTEQDLSITFLVFTAEGVMAFSTSTAHNSSLRGKRLGRGLYQTRCRIPANLLNSNVYRAMLLAVKNQRNIVFKMEEALAFEVQDSMERRGAYHGKRPGAVAPVLSWEMQPLREKEAL